MRPEPFWDGEWASLLDLDASLASVLGSDGTESVGSRDLMPVVRVPAGAWRPAAGSLPAGTFAVGLLEGLLIRETAARSGASLSGPGDLVEPWSASSELRWIVWRPLRLAMLGSPLLAALRPWPEVLGRLVARALSQESRQLGHPAARWAGTGAGDRTRLLPDPGALDAMREAVTEAFARASEAYDAAVATSAEVASMIAGAVRASPTAAPRAAAAGGRARTARARDGPARRGR